MINPAGLLVMDMYIDDGVDKSKASTNISITLTVINESR